MAFRSSLIITTALVAACLTVFEVAAQRGGGGGGGGGGRQRPPGGTNRRTPQLNPPPPPVPDGIRLEVGWIAREPRLPPPSTLDARREEGWPAAGSAVHWVAHVFNRSDRTINNVAYEWRIDGTRALAGVVHLVPGGNELLLPWNWTFTRHQISLRIAPPAAAGDNTTEDNELTVASDALALVIYTQKGLHDWTLAERRPGFERLLQGEIGRWNAIFARAVYPTTPEGVRDRIRLDDIVVLREGQRPRNPDFRTSDLVWFLPTVSGDTRFLSTNMDQSRLGDQTILLHELLHERGLTDLYDYDIFHEWAPEGGKVNILENGRPVVGTFLMPPWVRSTRGMLMYKAPLNGIMGSYYAASADLTEHSANGLNLLAGRRTPWWTDRFDNVLSLGNVANPASYVHLVPEVTEVRLQDRSGTPIAGGTLDFYGDKEPMAYHETYAEGPDASVPIDARGVALVARDVALRTLPRDPLVKSRILIVSVRTARARGFAFLPMYEWNLEYFRGGGERGTLSLQVNMHPY